MTEKEIKLISEAIAEYLYGDDLPNLDYKALKTNKVSVNLITAPEWEITNECDTTFQGEAWINGKRYEIVASVPTNNWFCIDEWLDDKGNVNLPPSTFRDGGWYDPYENWYEF